MRTLKADGASTTDRVTRREETRRAPLASSFRFACLACLPACPAARLHGSPASCLAFSSPFKHRRSRHRACEHPCIRESTERFISTEGADRARPPRRLAPRSRKFPRIRQNGAGSKTPSSRRPASAVPGTGEHGGWTRIGGG